MLANEEYYNKVHNHQFIQDDRNPAFSYENAGTVIIYVSMIKGLVRKSGIWNSYKTFCR